MAKKCKKFADGGGVLITPQQNSNPTYPFQTTSSSAGTAPAGGAGSGVNQTFNLQPTVNNQQPQQQQQQPRVNPGLNFKKGGAVRSKASKRADGCAVRGKTRA